MSLDNLSVIRSVSSGANGMWNHFRYNGVLTKLDAFKLQEEYGNHPHGYGFYGYKVENGVTTWKCQTSCD